MIDPQRLRRRDYERLEKIGRIRLSQSFFLRDFLHSEIAAAYGIANAPVDLDLAVYTGRQLCETILEPLQQTFGRIHIRSGYRSPELNAFGAANRLSCASNEKNHGRHIWDVRDRGGHAGACACIVIPWFLEHFSAEEWPRLATWLDHHLVYDRIVVFGRQAALNIGWRESPTRQVRSYAEPKGLLSLDPYAGDAAVRDWSGFPRFGGPAGPSRG